MIYIKLTRSLLKLMIVIAWSNLGAQDNQLVTSKDGSGIIGYKDTPILPWINYYKHDPDRPYPKAVIPCVSSDASRARSAPSDAVILFNGQDLSLWEPNSWIIDDGELIATQGDLVTKQLFGSCQLHLEWKAPNPPQGQPLNHGNSGVFLMSRYEIQIFDSYTINIYADGMAAAVYGETPPLVNAFTRPGKWQIYDIIFSAPVFKMDQLKKCATVTMLHNGVLVHYKTKIHGPTGHRKINEYEAHPAEQPLRLQAHDNPVRFRNVWIRPLGN